MILSAGSRFGPYEILAALGAGGMGEVYRARDSRLGREVAVKVLREEVASDPDRLARFEREARTVAALNHPNIVTLYSVEDAEGVRFLTMELVDGDSLDRLVTAGGLPIARALRLSIALADALAAAHEKGITHRDLKPGNVMVSREGRVKVLDFGLAKPANAQPALAGTQVATVESPVSSAGQVVGTIPYMAPEQLRGGAVDARTDLELVLREVESGPLAASVAATATGAVASETPSIAVLPFANRSRDPDDEYFSDGLADELLNVLAKVRGLRVAARTSSFTFKGKPATIAEVGRALHVATVLEGSVRKSGNRARIAVQLIKVSDGYQLWSETYDRSLDDIFAVQDDIAQSVVKELRQALLGEEPDSKTSGEVRAEVAAAARGRGESSEAHRLYLQARFLIDRLSREDVATGLHYLRQALELEPGHALAWVQVAYALVLQAGYDWTPMVQGFEEARRAAHRALALDPDLAEAHSILGQIQRNHDWDWKGAESSFRRALELAPNNAEVLRHYAVLAYVLERSEEALRMAQASVELDPLSTVGYMYLGHIHRAAGRYAESLEAVRKALELAPERIVSHLLVSLILLALGRFQEAVAEAEREPALWARLCALAIVHRAAGHEADADHALRDLENNFGDTAAYQITIVHAARLDRDRAFEWLDRGVAQRDPGLPFATVEPYFRPLHDDLRWGAFMRKMGFSD